jgi:hypothetical protein
MKLECEAGRSGSELEAKAVCILLRREVAKGLTSRAGTMPRYYCSRGISSSYTEYISTDIHVSVLKRFEHLTSSGIGGFPARTPIVIRHITHHRS